MCEAILELFQDEVDIQTTKARNEGLAVGRNENLHITIKACKDLGGTEEKVYSLLINDYKLTDEQAKEYLEQYW